MVTWPMEFIFLIVLLNPGNSVTSHYSNRAQTCQFLCKRQGCYHSASKTHMRDRIDPKSYFSDLSDSLNEMKVPFHLGKTPMSFFGGLDTEKTLELRYTNDANVIFW